MRLTDEELAELRGVCKIWDGFIDCPEIAVQQAHHRAVLGLLERLDAAEQVGRDFDAGKYPGFSGPGDALAAMRRALRGEHA